MGHKFYTSKRPIFALVGLFGLLWAGCEQPGPPRGAVPSKDAAMELRQELAAERAANVDGID